MVRPPELWSGLVRVTSKDGSREVDMRTFGGVPQVLSVMYRVVGGKDRREVVLSSNVVGRIAMVWVDWAWAQSKSARHVQGLGIT